MICLSDDLLQLDCYGPIKGKGRLSVKKDEQYARKSDRVLSIRKRNLATRLSAGKILQYNFERMKPNRRNFENVAKEDIHEEGLQSINIAEVSEILETAEPMEVIEHLECMDGNPYTSFLDLHLRLNQKTWRHAAWRAIHLTESIETL